jgi:GTPase
MFTDSVTLSCIAGKGGNGVVAWRREKFIPKGGPAGGNGGNGASIYLRANPQVLSLQQYRNRTIIKAPSGESGSSALCQGKRGKDLILDVPCGTIVKESETNEILCDLSTPGEQFLLCKGGKGGKGNHTFRTPTNQAPNFATPGTEGETLRVDLELKLIADVGLVGMPNAGKSTLLSKIAKIPVKIAAYPFTTLQPNLSYFEKEDYTRVLIADIPGLIENAHKNRGLGISFLKHVERTHLLLFVIDISGLEGRDPFDDFQTLRCELAEYSEELLKKPFLVALNKIDLEESEENLAAFKQRYPFDPSTLFEISAAEERGLNQLKQALEGPISHF